MNRPFHPQRQGAVAPFVALIMFPVFLLMLAFAVDMGNICFTQSQLQRAADSGALAGAAELVKHTSATDANTYAVAEAQRVVAQLSAGNVSSLALASTDVQVGYTDQTSGDFTAYPNGSVTVNGVTYSPPFPNTVKVTVRRDTTTNNPQPTFFAGFFGQNSWSIDAHATANTIIASSFNPAAQGSLLLPFAIPETTTINSGNGAPGGIQVGWNDLMTMWRTGQGITVNGTTIPFTDNYSVGSTLNPPAHPSTPFGNYSVSNGSDRVPEITFYGNGTTGAGNFGLVSLNPTISASESNIATWVNQGPSAADLTTLNFPTSGQTADWWASGQGFKNATTTSVGDIYGEARLIPIYTTVQNPNGNNLQYNIVGFGAAIILNWVGNGQSANVTLQPTTVIDPSLAGTSFGNGAPPNAGGFSNVYAAPKLTQ